MSKYFKAGTIYVRAHQGLSIPAIAAALTGGEPYATLNDVKNESKSRAVRICR